ncbi:NHL repeat-containing protein [bacterium]|nr:NHL repeat-containing protein [bacterium]
MEGSKQLRRLKLLKKRSELVTKEVCHCKVYRTGRIFVADAGRVAIFDADGTVSGEITGLASPGNLVIKGGKLYIADSGAAKIKVYDMSGNKLNELTSGFSNPRGIDADEAGNVYVADTGNNRIVVMSANGVKLKEFGTQGSGDGELNAPEGVAVDDYGVMYVADTGNDRIQLFDGGGNFLGKMGDFKAGPVQFKTPKDIGLSREGILYIMDTGRNLLHKCQLVEPFKYEALEEIKAVMANIKSADILNAEECENLEIRGTVKGGGKINLTGSFLLHKITA